MSIEIRDGRYVSQIYFAKGPKLDVMGFLYRDPGEPFVLEYRFRYYVTSDPWDDKDRKSWYQVTSLGTDEGEACRGASRCFRVIAGQAAEGFYGKAFDLEVVPVRSDRAAVVLQRFREQPWVHMKAAPFGSEEAKRWRSQSRKKKKKPKQNGGAP